MSTSVQVGVEVDGTRVAVVIVQGEAASDITVVRKDSQQAALAAALAGTRRDDPVRAVVPIAGSRLSKLDLTSADLDRNGFSTHVHRAVGTQADGTSVAGLFGDVSVLRSGLAGTGLAATAPAQPVEQLYRDLSGRRPEVVPPAFVCGPLEGLSLAVRFAATELTLVHDGQPVASRQLPLGGLATVEAALGAGGGVGATRLASALAGSSSDLIATHALERYLRTMLLQVRDVLEDWARHGLRAGREVLVYGAGANAAGLDMLLVDAGLRRAQSQVLLSGLLRAAPAQRLEVLGAYLAAKSYGQQMPYAAFPDPARAAAEARTAHRRTVRRRITVLAASAAVVATGALGPIAVGQWEQHSANGALSAAIASLKHAGPHASDARTLSALTTASAALSARPDVSGVLPAVAHAFRGRMAVETITIAPTEGGVTRLTVHAHGSAADLAGVVAALQRVPHLSDVLPAASAGSGPDTDITITATVGDR